jgi:hypothetical protein
LAEVIDASDRTDSVFVERLWAQLGQLYGQRADFDMEFHVLMSSDDREKLNLWRNRP